MSQMAVHWAARF